MREDVLEKEKRRRPVLGALRLLTQVFDRISALSTLDRLQVAGRASGNRVRKA